MPGPARSSRRGSSAKIGRRIALGGRRLAGRQADLALGHGEAGHAVHHAQHVLALVAEIFGDRHGHVGRLPPHQRRFVGGGDDDDAARQAVLAQVLGDEFLHLAAALADQADDVDVDRHVARQHRHQHRLADAGAGEDAHALAAAAGQEGVDRADAEIDLAADAAARMGGRRVVADRDADLAGEQRPLAVDRLAQRIDDAAEPALVREHLRLAFRHFRLAAEPDAVQVAERHQERAAVAEADDLARNAPSGAGDDRAAAADGQKPLDSRRPRPVGRARPSRARSIYTRVCVQFR